MDDRRGSRERRAKGSLEARDRRRRRGGEGLGRKREKEAKRGGGGAANGEALFVLSQTSKSAKQFLVYHLCPPVFTGPHHGSFSLSLSGESTKEILRNNNNKEHTLTEQIQKREGLSKLR